MSDMMTSAPDLRVCVECGAPAYANFTLDGSRVGVCKPHAAAWVKKWMSTHDGDTLSIGSVPEGEA